MTTKALGLIETIGLITAIEAADTALKAANVKLLGYENTKGAVSYTHLTKIIILTAHDEFSYVQKALELGAVDFLLKPVRPAKLIEVLNEVYGCLLYTSRCV